MSRAKFGRLFIGRYVPVIYLLFALAAWAADYLLSLMMINLVGDGSPYTNGAVVTIVVIFGAWFAFYYTDMAASFGLSKLKSNLGAIVYLVPLGFVWAVLDILVIKKLFPVVIDMKTYLFIEKGIEDSDELFEPMTVYGHYVAIIILCLLSGYAIGLWLKNKAIIRIVLAVVILVAVLVASSVIVNAREKCYDDYLNAGVDTELMEARLQLDELHEKLNNGEEVDEDELDRLTEKFWTLNGVYEEIFEKAREKYEKDVKRLDRLELSITEASIIFNPFVAYLRLGSDVLSLLDTDNETYKNAVKEIYVLWVASLCFNIFMVKRNINRRRKIRS